MSQSNLGLRGKIIGTSAITIVVAISFIYLLAHTIGLDSYLKLEQAHTTQDVQRVFNTFSSEIATMVATTLDWSSWDDTYYFAQGGMPNYISANLGDSIFSSLNLNVMVFLDTTGKVVYAKGYDPASEKEVSVSPSLLSEFKSNTLFMSPANIDTPVVGIIMDGKTPLLLISEPILTNTSTGPAAGRLFFGRYLDDAVIVEIGQRNLLQLKLFPAQNFVLPSDVQIAKQNLSVSSPIFTLPLDQNTSAGYGLINDIYGQPAFIFRLNESREIYQQGENTITSLFDALTIVGILAGLIGLVLLDRLLLKRLARLSAGLGIIRESGSPALRLQVEGRDELGRLANAINETLESLDQSRANLFANQEMLKTVITSAPLILFAVDLNGVVTLLEGKGLNTLGMRPDEIIGHSVTDKDSPMAELYKDIQPGLLDTASATATIGTYSFDIRYTPLRDPNGTIRGVAGVATDITDRKRIQQEQLEAEHLRLDLAKDREVMTVKERFIATLSHEFRSPLAVILAAKESLQHYYDRMQPERRAEHFQNIEEQTRRMLLLLDDLLTISKTSDGKMQFKPMQADLRPLCQKLFDEVRMTDQLGRRFVFDCNEPELVTNVDKRLLHHIVVNLLSNAVKYSPADGDVRFELAKTDDTIVIRISDQGIGIPEADQAHLFEPYYRATNTGSIQGTGLGLTIVKESVEAHGGTIACESKQGKGTTFIVHLPLSEPASNNTPVAQPIKDEGF